MHRFAQEFMPRLIGCMVVFIAAMLLLIFLSNKDENTRVENLKEASSTTAIEVANWLYERSLLANQIAEDPRVLAGFYDAERLGETRTALYEFGNINELEEVYIFALDTTSIIARKAGAPLCPLLLLTLLPAHTMAAGAKLPNL